MAKPSLRPLLLSLLVLPLGAADTVKIALTGPFSGGSAPMGVSMRDGAKLAIAGIVEDDIEPSERLPALRHRLEGRRAIGDVQSQGQDRLTI